LATNHSKQLFAFYKNFIIFDFKLLSLYIMKKNMFLWLRLLEFLGQIQLILELAFEKELDEIEKNDLQVEDVPEIEFDESFDRPETFSLTTPPRRTPKPLQFKATICAHCSSVFDLQVQKRYEEPTNPVSKSYRAEWTYPIAAPLAGTATAEEYSFLPIHAHKLEMIGQGCLLYRAKDKAHLQAQAKATEEARLRIQFGFYSSEVLLTINYHGMQELIPILDCRFISVLQSGNFEKTQWNFSEKWEHLYRALNSRQQQALQQQAHCAS